LSGSSRRAASSGRTSWAVGAAAPGCLLLAEPDREEREAATAAAMRAGAPVIVGGRLPADPDSRQAGNPICW